MKFLVTALVLTLSLPVFAHDEGHGPKIPKEQQAGKFGGVMASVIAESDIPKGVKAVRIYKAELIRSEEDDISMYIYDEKMNLLTMERFSPTANAELEIEKNHKFLKTPFTLKVNGKKFEGKAPKPEKRPFNIDIHFTEAGKKLFVAFDNLD